MISLALGAWFLGEGVGWGKLTAAGITLAGVALMVGGHAETDGPPDGPSKAH